MKPFSAVAQHSLAGGVYSVLPGDPDSQLGLWKRLGVVISLSRRAPDFSWPRNIGSDEDCATKKVFMRKLYNMDD